MKRINDKLDEALSHLDEKYGDYKFYQFIKQLIEQITAHQIGDSGAMLTYYFILSVFPFLIFLLSIFSFTPFADLNLVAYIREALPVGIGDQAANIVQEVIESRNEAILSTSIIFAVYSSSRGISGMIRSINKAYNAEETRNFVFRSILAIVFTIFLVVLIIVMLGTLVFGRVIINDLFVWLQLEEFFVEAYHLMRLSLPIVSMFIIYSLLYKFAPNKKVSLKSTFPGAIFATLGGIISSMGFAFYVNNFGKYNVTYGSLGGIIVLLVWINLIGCIIVLGAEINGALIMVSENYKIEKE